MEKNNTSSSSNQPNQPTHSIQPFNVFINNFKDTIKRVYREENDINKLSLKRGISSDILAEIMTCNPLSLSIPLAYGGRGGTVSENLQLLSVASYESMALSLTLGINSALFLQPVSKYAQEEAKRDVFNRFLNSQQMGGLMITEPTHGSDALNMQTSYIENQNNYHITGTKHWAGLTGQANFWLLTARKKNETGLLRDVDFFIADNDAPNQNIIVDEYFENLGLYQIPYGRNKINVQIPKQQKLIPHSTGVKMMLDLLHRSRLHFPGMGLGFIQRMLDEGITHCKNRQVGGKNLLEYDQVQHRLAQLQANYTICSAFCMISSQMADISNDLTGSGLEANIIKTVTTDLMQDSAQTLLTLVGAKGYKLNHIAGRGTVDTRPFQIFEGSNDILYAQIGEWLMKSMKTTKEYDLYKFLKNHNLSKFAADILKDLTSFEMQFQLSQRKTVQIGIVLSRIVSLNFVVQLGEIGFRYELIEGAKSLLTQEIAGLINNYEHKQNTLVVEDYSEGSLWNNYI